MPMGRRNKVPVSISKGELGVTRYNSRCREPFELCPHFKSLSSTARRELSIDLRWRASGPKPEFPAPEIGAQNGCAQGELGVKMYSSG